MKRSERDLGFLWDMLGASREISRFVDGVTYESLVRDAMRVRAIERSFEILGEASARISPGARSSIPEWIVLAHEYSNIDYRKLHETATIDIPLLIVALERVTAAE